MGSNNSQVDDRQSLINSGDGFTDAPLFKNLDLVIIGSHRSGKSTVGNVILGHKGFTCWSRFYTCFSKKSGKLSGRTITLVRVPGWTGDLSTSVSKQKQTKQQLVHSVQSHYEIGPHALLFVLDVDSTITDTTIQTLEGLLSEEIWHHTVMIFTHGKKLEINGITIEDQIRVNRLTDLVEKCGKRFYVLKKSTLIERAKLIETLEYFIADKDAPVQFCLSDTKMEKRDDLKEKRSLIQIIRDKITLLNNYQKLTDSKDAEIRRLQCILQKREEDVRRLEGQLAQAQNCSKHSSRCVECVRKDEEICRLRKENSILKSQVQNHSESPRIQGYSELNILASLHQTQMFTGNPIELQQLPLSSTHHELHCDVLCKWPITLVDILEDLSVSDLERMKFLIHFEEEWKIPKSSLDVKEIHSLVTLLIQAWGEKDSIINIRNILKEIPRKDSKMKKLIMPHLEAIGERW